MGYVRTRHCYCAKREAVVPMQRIQTQYALFHLSKPYLRRLVNCAERLCLHTLLVFLHLSPHVASSPLYRRLVQRDDAPVIAAIDSDSDDETAPGADSDTLLYQARYAFVNHRYPEESKAIRKLVNSKHAECPLAQCPSRGRIGRGDTACDHTFPMEFRPPASLTVCPRCGEDNVTKIRFTVVASFTLFIQVRH